MIIQKFGGTSVGSPKAIKKVIEIVKISQPSVVVVSAYTTVTDQLIAMAEYAVLNDKQYRKEFKSFATRHLDSVKELIADSQNQMQVMKQVHLMNQELESILLGIWLIKELSLKTLDLVMSFGERLSAYIISESFRDRNIPTECIDARKLIKTNDHFGNAKVDFKKTNTRIKKRFLRDTENSLKIVTGFIASTNKNETTTLGRGGSDYTVAIFGAALNANTIEIWTDVDGVMTADPKKVSNAFPIPSMTYQEAMEISHFGAKVIHPPTMIPAMEKHIPLVIKNTFHPEFAGTYISEKSSNGTLIKGISSIPDVAVLLIEGSGMIGLPGVAMRLFGALGKNKINIILITQASSEHTICLAIDPKEIAKAKKAIEEEFVYEIKEKVIDPVIIEKDRSIIAIVGEHIKKTPGIAGKFFTALGKNNINIVAIAQGSSELNISVIIAKKDEENALREVHRVFFGK